MNAASFIDNFKRLYGALTIPEQRRYLRLLLLNFTIALLDLVGLALLYGIAMLMLDPAKASETVNKFSLPQIFYSKNGSWYLSILLTSLFLLKNILTFLLSKKQVHSSYQLVSGVSSRQFKEFLNRDFLRQKSDNTTRYIHELNSVADALPNHIILQSVQFFTEILFLLLAITVVAIVSIKVILLFILTILPVTLIIMVIQRKRLVKYGHILNSIVPRFYQSVYNAVHGFSDIRLFKKEKHFTDNFQSERDNLFEYRSKVYVLSSVVPVRIVESAVILSLLVLVSFVFLSGNQENMIAFLTLFAALAFRALPSVNRLIASFNSLNGFSYIIDLLPHASVEELSTGDENFELSSSIALQNISFSFGEEEVVLNQVSLDIPKGACVGIKGESGQGKSTLLNLILGFYSPQSGEILIDNRNLEEVKYAWQSQLAYVQQNAFMLNDSIAANVAFGDPNYNAIEVEDVLRKVSLWPWVDNLEGGINMRIGEQGAMISDGQRQRLAIARALYSKAKVVILDEAVNALDDITKLEVLNTIGVLKEQGCTVIVAAHDKANFKYCDAVYELQNGSLTHEKS